MTIKYANGSVTRLAAPMGSGDTTCDVLDASYFPASGDFPIKIDSEYILVGGVSGDTFTGLTRGYDGSAAASHAINKPVYGVLLKSTMELLATKAYADQGDANTASAAASDATSKANAAAASAISTASSDATSKANAAISTAASDATSKANAAISTAASDATTKANAARDAAIAEIPDFGDGAGESCEGNNPRLPPAPGTRGRIMIDNGTNWVVLEPGTAGKWLRTNGSGADPSWENLTPTPGVPMKDLGVATKGHNGTPKSVLAILASNANTSTRYFQLFDLVADPVAGVSTPLFSFPVFGSSELGLGSNFFGLQGTAFALGVAWAWSTTKATFTDAATAADHTMHIQVTP